MARRNADDIASFLTASVHEIITRHLVCNRHENTAVIPNKINVCRLMVLACNEEVLSAENLFGRDQMIRAS